VTQDTVEMAEFFKCLSEPVRLRILYLLLAHKELCVCDLVSGLGLSQSVVSRHLAYMRKTGLVNTRRDGVWIYYQLEAQLPPMVLSVLAAFRQGAANCQQMVEDLQSIKNPMAACQ